MFCAGGFIDRVLYLCGTAEELSNVTEEFKRSSYASMRMVVMTVFDDLQALFAPSNQLLTDTDIKKDILEPCIILSTQKLFFEVILTFPSPRYDLKVRSNIS